MSHNPKHHSQISQVGVAKYVDTQGLYEYFIYEGSLDRQQAHNQFLTTCSIVQYKLHNIQAPTFGVAIAWLEIDHEAQKRINRKIADSKRVPVSWSV